MKKIVGIALSFCISFCAMAQKEYVELQYAQDEDVYVVLDDRLVGRNPKGVKIDFELNSSLNFFKRGYYTQRVDIEPETVIGKMKIDLVKKPKDASIPQKTLLIPDTLLISDIVTNMDQSDIWEIVNKNFVKNNYYIGNSIALFPGAKDEIQNSRYRLSIEVVKSKQIRHVYKSPKFMMGYIKMRWALLDKNTNEVTFFEETEGSYFVKITSTKGLVVSEKMKVVMEGAIREAQFKLITNETFIKLVQEK